MNTVREESISMTARFKPCIIIPVYNHELPLTRIVERLQSHDIPCILIDDGSRESCSGIMRGLSAQYPQVRYIRLDPNRGKGSAVKAGLLEAKRQNFTHAIQIDADGQHDLGDLDKFLAAAEAHPDAVIAGQPIFDASIPKGRYYARYLTHVWVWINTLSFCVRDSMCGYRAYPVDTCVELIQTAHLGDRMDFDVEVLIRLYWQGVPIIPLPTRVGYPEDGISHFRPWEDNAKLSLMQARMFLGMLRRMPKLLSRHFR